MIPLEYCLQKAAPAGSSTYYALRQARPAQRPALTALYAYRRELADTVLESSDPGVAQTKLGWWRGETSNAGAGQPSHPVSRALLDALPDLSAYTGRLLDLASGYEADLMQSRYLDFPGLNRYLESVNGRFAMLIADVANATGAKTKGQSISKPDGMSEGTPEDRTNDKAGNETGGMQGTRSDEAALLAGNVATSRQSETHRWAAPLGVALGLAAIVADVGADARHGRIYLPISEMQRFGVTAADILNRRYSDAYTELMRFQTERARKQLRDALAAMPASMRTRQAALRAQAAMALRLLDEIEGEAFQVLHQRIALTPIRNLLVSWRATHWS